MIPRIDVIFDAGTGFYRVRKNIKTPWLDVFPTHSAELLGDFYFVNIFYDRGFCLQNFFVPISYLRKI